MKCTANGVAVCRNHILCFEEICNAARRDFSGPRYAEVVCALVS
jgi:hypothetical protein